MEDYSFCPKVATGYSRLAIDLENHTKNYTPTSWTVPINNVTSVPYITENESKTFMNLHKRDMLKSGLEKLGNCKKSEFKKFNRWYIKEAITDFFEKEIYESYKKEL